MFDEVAESPDRQRSDHESLTNAVLGIARFRHVVGVDEPILVAEHMPLLDQPDQIAVLIGGQQVGVGLPDRA